MPNTAEKVQQAQRSLKKGIKTKMFDLISVGIIVALICVSLGVIERRVITLSEIGDVIVECIPFFFAFVLLGNNYYMKGSYAGKDTQLFEQTCTAYSDIVSTLSDEEIDSLDEFCEEYNATALKRAQEALLKRAAITYDRFDKGDKNNLALKLLTNKTLKAQFGDERAKWIILAKKVHVKGIKTNMLMGTNDTDDITDIGPTEAQLLTSHRRHTVMNYALSTILMTFIGVKDITTWHLFGFALVVFKCVFIFCKAYVEYFSGYNDVTIHLVNHTNRKADILKQHRHWYSNKPDKKIDNKPDVAVVDTKIVNEQLEISAVIN